MEYNVEGLERLIKKLGLELVVERMLETGISYEQLAVALNRTFDPLNQKVFEFYLGLKAKVCFRLLDAQEATLP